MHAVLKEQIAVKATTSEEVENLCTALSYYATNVDMDILEIKNKLNELGIPYTECEEIALIGGRPFTIIH